MSSIRLGNTGGAVVGNKYSDQNKTPLFGRAIDGNVNIVATTGNINTSILGVASGSPARTVDAAITSVTAISGLNLTVSSSTNFRIGDTALLINMWGTSVYFSQVGKWERVLITDVPNATTITIANAPRYLYGQTAPGPSNSDLSGQRIVLQRIPEYNTVTLSANALSVITANANTRASIGGIVAFMCKTLNAPAPASISANALGYAGGDASVFNFYNGDSYNGQYQGSIAGFGGSTGLIWPASIPTGQAQGAGGGGGGRGGGGGGSYGTAGTAGPGGGAGGGGGMSLIFNIAGTSASAAGVGGSNSGSTGGTSGTAGGNVNPTSQAGPGGFGGSGGTGGAASPTYGAASVDLYTAGIFLGGGGGGSNASSNGGAITAGSPAFGAGGGGGGAGGGAGGASPSGIAGTDASGTPVQPAPPNPGVPTARALGGQGGGIVLIWAETSTAVNVTSNGGASPTPTSNAGVGGNGTLTAPNPPSASLTGRGGGGGGGAGWGGGGGAGGSAILATKNLVSFAATVTGGAGTAAGTAASGGTAVNGTYTPGPNPTLPALNGAAGGTVSGPAPSGGLGRIVIRAFSPTLAFTPDAVGGYAPVASAYKGTL